MSSTQGLVSIIIVNWNGQRWLERCLASVEAQTYQERELIVVDNASTDQSLALIKTQFPQAQLIEQPTNQGFAAGNGAGIRRAKGRFILLLNSDTWIEPNFLAELVKRFEERQVDLLGVTEIGYQARPDRAKGYISTIDILGYPVPYTTDLDQRRSFYISGACLFFEKPLYQQTQGFDESFFLYAEEVDWCWRLHLLGKKLYQEPDLFIHHASGGSIGASLKPQTVEWTNLNILQTLLKNYAWYSLLWALPLYLLQNLGEMAYFGITGQGQLSLAYLRSWSQLMARLPSLWPKRQWVQRHRQIGDLPILAMMHLGSGKLRQLLRARSKP